jgi:hypothetical protein
VNTILISHITKKLPESQMIPHKKSTETAIHDSLESAQKAIEKKDKT